MLIQSFHQLMADQFVCLQLHLHIEFQCFLTVWDLLWSIQLCLLFYHSLSSYLSFQVYCQSYHQMSSLRLWRKSQRDLEKIRCWCFLLRLVWASSFFLQTKLFYFIFPLLIFCFLFFSFLSSSKSLTASFFFLNKWKTIKDHFFMSKQRDKTHKKQTWRSVWLMVYFVFSWYYSNFVFFS